MKIHVRTYLDFFDIGSEEKILCTICGNVAVDIHHIHPKGMGGCKTFIFNKVKYLIECINNYITLCRKCHDKAHTNELDKGMLWVAQQTKIIKHR